ncbi:SoxR reducing system RseC family protein [Celerinatantimonas sp. YJH-8]|uniref:SoxR reducing system RseC family protein n=1 Tax=Celerinatantimonas sp. YJH-8 TaxID=3228714 RepID=UPI0038CB9644
MSNQKNMVTEVAQVIDVKGDFAIVECISRSACGSCHAADNCGNSSIAKAFKPHTNRFQVKLKHPVLPGQRIEIGLPAQSVVHSAVLVYLLPLVVMMFGVAVAVSLFGSADSVALSGCVIGGAIGFLGARFWAKRLEKKNDYQPVMLSVSQ